MAYWLHLKEYSHRESESYISLKVQPWKLFSNIDAAFF